MPTSAGSSWLARLHRVLLSIVNLPADRCRRSKFRWRDPQDRSDTKGGRDTAGCRRQWIVGVLPEYASWYFSLLRYREIGLAASKSFQRCRRVVDHPGDTHPAERAEAPVQMPDDTGEIAKPLSAETHVPIPYSLQFRTRMSANPSKFGYSDLVTATAPVRPETDA